MKITALKDGKRVEGKMTDLGLDHKEGCFLTRYTFPGRVITSAADKFLIITIGGQARYDEDMRVLRDAGYTDIEVST